MAIDKKKVRVNRYPKISLNTLGEYLTVGPSRRKTIVRDQKYQKTFITARYADAEKAIVEFIVGGMQNEQLLEDAIKSLLSQNPSSDWWEQVHDNCVDAIDSFFDMYDGIPLKAAIPCLPQKSPPKMLIADVSVSVRPEIILEDNAANIVGAIKLYFRKTKELSEDTGKLIATVLRRYLSDTLGAEPTVKAGNCLVLDIFAGRIHIAPKSFKKAMQEVESACEEIHSRWPSVKKP